MSNAILSWVNRVDSALFATDSQSSTLPASNLADPSPQKVWRTTGATSAYVEVDFQASHSISVLCLAGLSISASDTIRHRLSNVSAGAGELLDTGAVASGVVSGYSIAPYVIGPPVTARYWRIDIAAPSQAPLGYFQIGRAWAGLGFTPAVNMKYGFEEEWLDHTLITRAGRSGVEFVDSIYQQRRVSFQLGFLTETEALDTLREMSRLTGIRNQVLFIPDPASSRIKSEAIIGRMTETSPIGHVNFSVHQKAFQIMESR